MSIKSKFILYFFGIFLLIASLLSVYFIHHQMAGLVKAKEETFRTIANSIAANYSSTLFTLEKLPEDKIIIAEQLRQLSDFYQRNVSGFAGLMLIDKKGGRIFGRFLSADLEAYLAKGAPVPPADGTRFPEGEGEENWETALLGDQRFQILYKSIFFPVKDQVYLSGAVAVAFSLAHIYGQRNQVLGISLLIILLTAVVSFVFIYLTFTLLTRRIYGIVYSVKALSRGEFVKTTPRGKDEISLLMQETNRMIDSVREKLLLSRYVSESTLNFVTQAEAVCRDHAGEERLAAIFFSDVRGFSSFTERNSPRKVVTMLNDILNFQVEIIKKHGGDIDKFVGDAVMAVFYGEDKEKRAVAAACEIQQKLKRSGRPLRIGIGITSGTVVWGNIGGKDRVDGTCIGDAVNTASRLCALALADEIVVTAPIIGQNGDIDFEGPESSLVKGKEEPVATYRVRV